MRPETIYQLRWNQIPIRQYSHALRGRLRSFQSEVLPRMRIFFAAFRKLFSGLDWPQATILSIGSPEVDRTVLDQLAHAHSWKLYFTSSYSEANASILRVQPHIILLDRELAVAWRIAVTSLAATSGGACVILISHVVDDYLWNEVVLHGGYDVVRKPLSEGDVLRIVKLAWAYWRAMHWTGSAVKK